MIVRHVRAAEVWPMAFLLKASLTMVMISILCCVWVQNLYYPDLQALFKVRSMALYLEVADNWILA
jgi:hypothetical protein